MTNDYTIRLATPRDAADILAIYAPYITDTTVTFETQVPTLEAFTQRVETISARYPYIVCEHSGCIVGYAYASRHAERAAYLYDVNVSVYITAAHHGKGIAMRLYDALFALLKRCGYINAYAVISLPNEPSCAFHEKYGFTQVGTFRRIGYKHGVWLDVMWLEKRVNGHEYAPNAVYGMDEIDTDGIL